MVFFHLHANRYDKGVWRRKQKGKLAFQRRKVIGDIRGGVGKSREWLVVMIVSKKNGKG